MSDSLLIRKEFEISDEQYFSIFDCIVSGAVDDDSLAEFVYEQGDYMFFIDLSPADNGEIYLNCILSNKKTHVSLYSTTYTIENIEQLYNVFMIDTQYKEANELKNKKHRAIEFYFTFYYADTEDIDMLYTKNHNLPQMSKNITNIVALMKYNSLENNDLFRLLIEFVFIIDDLKDLIAQQLDTKYMLNQLEYLKDKLSYAGYDEDYLKKHYSKPKRSMNNDEIISHLLVVTLDYLYNDSTKFKLKNTSLSELSKTYCQNVSLTM